MQITTRDAMAGPRRELGRPDRDDLHYNLRISVWVRWFLLTAWLLQFNYRPNFADPAYIPTMLLAVSLLALNGYVHYRIQSRRTVTWRWALALSVMDGAMITAGIAISSSGFQNTFFVLYYPALAMFAVVFTSFRLSFAWVTMVAVVYGAMSLVMEPGVDYGIKEEKVLFTRIVVMYAVVAAVNLVSRFERTRRREAVEREGEQSGKEPRLSTVTRGLLFAIAHNAMTNAFRHARADRVAIALNFDGDGLRMSVADDGIGLPDDYAERGHGFRNMRRDVERMGGILDVGSGESGRGTTVTCVVPYDANRGGA